MAFTSHTYDLATQIPSDHCAMIMMSWYSIRTDDPTPGQDPTYGNWNLDGATWSAANPTEYPAKKYALDDAAVCNGGQRRIASNLRPLVGIYSDTGLDAASIAKIDLDLQMLKRTGEDRLGVTHIAPHVSHLKFTSHYSVDPAATSGYTSDIGIRHLKAVIARAEAAGLTNCVSIDYVNWHLWFGPFVDLYPTQQNKLDAMEQDIVDLMTILDASTACYRINGKPLMYSFQSGGTDSISTAEWDAMLDGARTTLDFDFYHISRRLNATTLDHADGFFPWIKEDAWDALAGQGLSDRERARQWIRNGYQSAFDDVTAKGAGRVAIGHIWPSFVDYGKSFGDGINRWIPRNEDIWLGQLDALLEMKTAGDEFAGYAQLWNDYPEGTCMEPDVEFRTEHTRTIMAMVSLMINGTYDTDPIDVALAYWDAHTPVITCPAPYTQPSHPPGLARSPKEG